MQRAPAINLDFSINSGQVFLWKKISDKWYGIDGNEIIVIRQDPFTAFTSPRKTRSFFREDDHIGDILQRIGKDDLVRKATRQFCGLRLLRQDPFQCYISFICSSNSSISNIKRMLTNLCKKFGTEIEFDGKQFFTFPTAETLSDVSHHDLLSCGLGFRARYVSAAAKAVRSGKIDFDSLKKEDYLKAHEKLKTVPGIGNKVADCILLFSLDKLESFPIDRWTMRVLQKYYPEKFPDSKDGSLTDRKYSHLHEKIVEYFGPYAGYSQQFLFKMERDLNKKNWL